VWGDGATGTITIYGPDDVIPWAHTGVRVPGSPGADPDSDLFVREIRIPDQEFFEAYGGTHSQLIVTAETPLDSTSIELIAGLAEARLELLQQRAAIASGFSPRAIAC